MSDYIKKIYSLYGETPPFLTPICDFFDLEDHPDHADLKNKFAKDYYNTEVINDLPDWGSGYIKYNVSTLQELTAAINAAGTKKEITLIGDIIPREPPTDTIVIENKDIIIKGQGNKLYWWNHKYIDGDTYTANLLNGRNTFLINGENHYLTRTSCQYLYLPTSESPAISRTGEMNTINANSGIAETVLDYELDPAENNDTARGAVLPIEDSTKQMLLDLCSQVNVPGVAENVYVYQPKRLLFINRIHMWASFIATLDYMIIKKDPTAGAEQAFIVHAYRGNGVGTTANVTFYNDANSSEPHSEGLVPTSENQCARFYILNVPPQYADWSNSANDNTYYNSVYVDGDGYIHSVLFQDEEILPTSTVTTTTTTTTTLEAQSPNATIITSTTIMPTPEPDYNWEYQILETRYPTFVVKGTGRLKVENAVFYGNSIVAALRPGIVELNNCTSYAGGNYIVKSTMNLSGANDTDAMCPVVRGQDTLIYIKDCTFIHNLGQSIAGRILNASHHPTTIIQNCTFNNCNWLFVNYGNVKGYEGNWYIANNTFRNCGGSNICAASANRLSTSWPVAKYQCIELNTCIQDVDFIEKQKQDGSTDIGAIYIAPNNLNCIVRWNIIDGFGGRKKNCHGIYFDDSAYNIACFGNIILNVDNGYSISARYAGLAPAFDQYRGRGYIYPTNVQELGEVKSFDPTDSATLTAVVLENVSNNKYIFYNLICGGVYMGGSYNITYYTGSSTSKQVTNNTLLGPNIKLFRSKSNTLEDVYTDDIDSRSTGGSSNNLRAMPLISLPIYLHWDSGKWTWDPLMSTEYKRAVVAAKEGVTLTGGEYYIDIYENFTVKDGLLYASNIDFSNWDPDLFYWNRTT